MFRRAQAITAVLCLPILGVLTNGCSDDEKSTPQVIFSSYLENGSGHGTGWDCKDSGDLFNVGDFGNQNVDPKIPSKSIKDGESFEQGSVSVSCSVTPAGTDEFSMSGSIELSGATGGLFRLDGKFKTTGEQGGLHVFISKRASGNSYESKDENSAVTRDCIGRYEGTFMGVASGRVWVLISCPHVRNTNANTACALQTQVRFENCGQ